MKISVEKYYFLINNVSNDVMEELKEHFPFKTEALEGGFKYLGFWLKPLDYRVTDWSWLIKKIDCKINNCTYIFLSLGGHLILLNSILGALPVYWFYLMKIPGSILQKIRSLMFNFLWGGNAGKKMHMESWESLS